MTPSNARQAVRLAVSAFGLGAALVASACSGKANDGTTIGDPTPGATSGSGAGANGPGMLDLGGSSNTPLGTGGGVAVEACATDTLKAERSPVNMFIQFDRSGSMNESDKWPQAAGALNAFFQDPSTAGLRVALRFFPDESPVPGCTRDATVGMACDVATCSQPLVALGELMADAAPVDLHEKKLLDAVAASGPPVQGAGDGGTPMYAALAGALSWAQAQKAATPDEKTIVVLVTDGSPSGCNTRINDIAQLASDALTTSGVSTYAIGIEGAQERQVNQIAAAGGTQQAFFVGALGAELQLIQALNAIRGAVLSCDLALPKGNNVDPGKVNVQLTPTGTAPEVIGQAAGPDNCEAGGWHYDNPAAPKRISLCPSTCQRVQADGGAQIDIVLGCEGVNVK